MKYIRTETSQGQRQWARLHDDNSIEPLNAAPWAGGKGTGERVKEARRLAPAETPVIYCIGLNYRRHAEETKAQIPSHPILFMKPASALQHPGGAIELPRGLPSETVDYECELAVVIGKRAKNIPPERALEHVFGYTCANDVSARDWQIKHGGSQWCRGKSFDTFCPLGPVLVGTDEIPDPQGLGIRTRVNGETLQDCSTGDMIFPIAQLVSFLSGSTTLEPGTVILTGTPHGVGMARDPKRWLAPGDVVEIEIDGIGILRNPVVEEPAKS